MTSDAATTAGAAVTQNEVLAAVAQLIGEVVGEDFLIDTPISMETSFNLDLELESIEFVALAELVSERYGDTVDFISWLGGMELQELIDLKVGQLVEHITATGRS
jgi:acyl carrier protein